MLEALLRKAIDERVEPYALSRKFTSMPTMVQALCKMLGFTFRQNPSL